jgi:hypothetical protein
MASPSNQWSTALPSGIEKAPGPVRIKLPVNHDGSDPSTARVVVVSSWSE